MNELTKKTIRQERKKIIEKSKWKKEGDRGNKEQKLKGNLKAKEEKSKEKEDKKKSTKQKKIRSEKNRKCTQDKR